MEFVTQYLRQIDIIEQALRSATLPAIQSEEMTKNIRAASQNFHQFDAFGNTLRSMASSAKQLADMTKGMRAASQSLHQFDTLGNTLRSMPSSAKQLADMKKGMRAANQSFYQFDALGNTLRSMALPLNQYVEMAKSINSISNSRYNVLKEDIVINDDNTLSCADKTFDLSDFESDIRNIVEEVIDPKNINRKLESLEKKIDSIKKDPLYKQILIAILVWIITTFCLEPIIKNQFAQYSAQNKNSIVKRIQKNVSSLNIEKELLKDYRIVSTNVLDVRAKNKRKSELRGRLYFGQFVYVVRKNRNWTLIESKDSEGNVVLRGWVFGRYLEKVIRKK
jgi:hypothetical protein